MCLCKCLMLILCVFIICTKTILAVQNSKITDISVLKNIFKPKHDMNCIQDYGINVSNHLNQLDKMAVKNTSKLCFLIKGSLSKEPGVNHVNLSALVRLSKLQELWIFPALHKSQVNKEFLTSLRFNKVLVAHVWFN